MGFGPPLTLDNLRMLACDSGCDPDPACAAFGLTPLEAGLRTWLAPA